MKRGRNDEKINHILNKCGCIFIGFILIFSLFSIPVRANKDKTTIPIIALTANAFEEDRKKAVAQGMNGHISKPIDVDKIEKVLLSILK